MLGRDESYERICNQIYYSGTLKEINRIESNGIS